MSRSIYTPEIAAEICERIANGESLKRIVEDGHMPSETTVLRWLADNEMFRGQYARAREAQIEHYADEMVDIADGVAQSDQPAVVQAAKLAIDTRKWIAAKRMPKKYGDKLDVTGHVTLEQLVTSSFAPQVSEGE